jgi:peptide/nickel transport system substrate-binding protein
MKDHKFASLQIESVLERPIDRRDLLREAIAGAGGLVGISLLERASSAAADTPKRGGNLRVAILGGTSADTLDAHAEVTQTDVTRAQWLYEPLVELDRDGHLVNVLAESIEANVTATEWTIRLRKGVIFHNGRPVTANDLVD